MKYDEAADSTVEPAGLRRGYDAQRQATHSTVQLAIWSRDRPASYRQAVWKNFSGATTDADGVSSKDKCHGEQALNLRGEICRTAARQNEMQNGK